MNVEELERFGAALEMPKEAVKEQGKIMFLALARRLGREQAYEFYRKGTAPDNTHLNK